MAAKFKVFYWVGGSIEDKIIEADSLRVSVNGDLIFEQHYFNIDYPNLQVTGTHAIAKGVWVTADLLQDKKEATNG